MNKGYLTALALGATALAATVELGAQAAAPAADQQGRTYRLNGAITDAGREPLAGAVVTVTSITPERSTTTNDRGWFDLGQFHAGSLTLRVRRLGFEQRVVQLEIGAGGQESMLDLALIPVAEELENVSVGASAEDRLRGFYQRKEQRGTFAKFVEEEEIRRVGASNPSELFRSVPGIRVAANPLGGNVIRIRNCQPMVWVNGQRIPGAELDELVVSSEIAGIEFYPSSAGIPAQYLERGNRLCGLILVWTKTE